MKLKRKLLFLLFFIVVDVHAINVIVAKESIAYQEKVNVKKLAFKQVSRIKKKCKPITLNYLNNKRLIAAHFINKNSIICERSLKESKKDSVLFDFGTIEIEKNVKVIRENDEFIMIKNQNGKKEKIYKDGRVK